MPKCKMTIFYLYMVMLFKYWKMNNILIQYKKFHFNL